MNFKTDLLLITPPLTQLNCPYPATMVLSGYLKSKNYIVNQLDLSIELTNSIFSYEFVNQIFDSIENQPLSKNYIKMVMRRQEYVDTVDRVMGFLRSPQTADESIFQLIFSLPQNSRFKSLKNIEFATQGQNRLDQAISRATFFIQDLSDLIRDNVNPHFELIRYGEKICSSIVDFHSIESEIDNSQNPINSLMINLLKTEIDRLNPKVIGFTIPFPGNFYAAMVCADFIKKEFSSIKIVFGGGFINTELRQMQQTNLFRFIDYLVFDDGELPLELILKYERDQIQLNELIRTWICDQGEILKINFDSLDNIPFSQRSFANYTGIPVEKYISLMETPNPMHNLWSVGFWNKITLAHGCYWANCAFCDTSLDYIKRFEPGKASYLVDQMESMMETTGSNGFHFTDEAAPPALLRKLSEEIIKRNLKIRWWGNIRFEKNFTAELAQLMAAAGCIAVSGGLETVSPRLLKLINKGVDIQSATQTLINFQDSGIMVHAYLMFGFPSQTTQETVDALEIVRQWFKAGLLHSGFWHRYAMTIHSPSFGLTEDYGVKKLSVKLNPFANNEVFFSDSTPTNHSALGMGLNKALYNYMLRNGFNFQLKDWFEIKIPSATVHKNLIKNIMQNSETSI